MSVCHARCARIVKFVGTYAVVEVKINFSDSASRRGSSRGRERRTVNDLTTNWPPNRRPLTSDAGLNEKSDPALAAESSFCFLWLFLSFFLLSSMVIGDLD